jgi:hypothetical protein
VSAGADTAASDATGRYTLQIAPGAISLGVAASGFEFGSATVTVAPGGTVEQDIALVEASATLTGTVFDTNTGLGVRAFVDVAYTTGVRAGFDGSYTTEVRAGVDGSYTITRVPAGQAQVIAHAQGYKDETVPVQLVANQTVSTNIYMGTNPHPPE